MNGYGIFKDKSNLIHQFILYILINAFLFWLYDKSLKTLIKSYKLDVFKNGAKFIYFSLGIILPHCHFLGGCGGRGQVSPVKLTTTTRSVSPWFGENHHRIRSHHIYTIKRDWNAIRCTLNLTCPLFYLNLVNLNANLSL